MVQVDSVIELLSEILQEFVRVEISLASQTNQDLIQSVLLLIAFQLLLILLIIYFISKIAALFAKISKIHWIV